MTTIPLFRHGVRWGWSCPLCGRWVATALTTEETLRGRQAHLDWHLVRDVKAEVQAEREVRA